MAADKARNYQALLGLPSISNFISYVSNNLMRDCDNTVDDIKQVEYIYGNPMPLSKLKMKKKTNKQSKITRIPLPLSVANRHGYLNMYMDILYTNVMVFWMSITVKINFYQ